MTERNLEGEPAAERQHDAWVETSEPGCREQPNCSDVRAYRVGSDPGTSTFHDTCARPGVYHSIE